MRTPNPYLCMVIVGFIGTLGLVALLGLVFLAWNGRTAPETLNSIISGSICSLASFLVVVPRGSVGVGNGNGNGNDKPQGGKP
jgi:hypothetical protein